MLETTEKQNKNPVVAGAELMARTQAMAWESLSKFFEPERQVKKPWWKRIFHR